MSLSQIELVQMVRVEWMSEFLSANDEEPILASVSECERKSSDGWMQDDLNSKLQNSRWLPSSS